MKKFQIVTTDWRGAILFPPGWHWEIWWDGQLVDESKTTCKTRREARAEAIKQSEKIANAMLRKIARWKK